MTDEQANNKQPENQIVYIPTPVSEKPPIQKIIVMTKDGNGVTYFFQGTDISYITLREQYTHWLKPVPLSELISEKDKLIELTNNNLLAALEEVKRLKGFLKANFIASHESFLRHASKMKKEDIEQEAKEKWSHYEKLHRL